MLPFSQAFEKAKRETAIIGDLVLLKEDRFDDALDFLMTHYITDEPCSRAKGQQLTPALIKFGFLLPFRFGLTVMLLKPGTNEIIAMQVMDIEGKNDRFVDENIDDQALSATNKLQNHITEAAEIFSKLGIEEIVGFEHLSVHRNFRKQDIATRLIEFCVKLLKYFGISPMYAKVHCSSNFSRKAFEKNGFSSICSVNYNEYFADGALVYPNMQEHTSFTCLVKRIA